MKKNDPIKNIMSSQTASVQLGQNLSEVRHLMTEKGFHHVPVVDGKKLVGLISFTDMMKLNLVVQGASEQTVDAILDQQFKISEVMTSDLTTISEGGNVRDAAEALTAGDFHSLPVVNDGGELAGIVTSTDLIKYLSDQY